MSEQVRRIILILTIEAASDKGFRTQAEDRDACTLASKERTIIIQSRDLLRIRVIFIFIHCVQCVTSIVRAQLLLCLLIYKHDIPLIFCGLNYEAVWLYHQLLRTHRFLSQSMKTSTGRADTSKKTGRTGDG